MLILPLNNKKELQQLPPALLIPLCNIALVISMVCCRIVIIHCQVRSMRGKVGVLDLVARFRVQNIISLLFNAFNGYASSKSSLFKYHPHIQTLHWQDHDHIAQFWVGNIIFQVFMTIIISIQVRNMSGYVTVYTDLSPNSATGSTQ